MKGRRRMCIRLLLWSLVLLLAAPPGGVIAQDQDPSAQIIFRQEDLDQMLAPIALYPDEILVQVLMAATYPLEVVQAARWVGSNPNLKGDQLAAVLEQQDWDPSVKSLVNFPSILQMMNDRLEWTQALGDAFLAQESQVMDTVQQLRHRSQAQGYLRNSNEQRVIVDPQTQEIIIEPATPQVVYVPVYDPMIVYGPWWWPEYQPYYYHPRGAVIRGDIIGFGLGVGLGVAWGYAWGGFNWHHHDVVINVTRNAHINRHIDRNRYVSRMTTGGGQGTWRHDPVHRGGVAYRSPSIATQYGRGPLPRVDTRRDFRGFDRSGTVAAQRPGGPPMVGQRRVAAVPNQVKPQPHPPKQPTTAIERQPRPIPAPQTKVEPPRQPTAPMEQPRVMHRSPVVSPEPSKQPVSRGRAEIQGIKGPSAFAGPAPGNQARQFSNRGHESLGNVPAGGQAPSGKKGPPRTEDPGGKGPRGGGNPGSSHGGR